MRVSLGMMAAAVLALASVAVPAWADDEEEAIPARELPTAVRKAVEKKFPGAEIERASRETEDGKTIFEVNLEAEEDQEIDVALTPDGKILEVEREISVAKLPEAVRETLSKKYPGAKIRKVEAISRGDGDEKYEVLLSAEVVLTAGGKIVKGEDDDEEDEDRD